MLSNGLCGSWALVDVEVIEDHNVARFQRRCHLRSHVDVESRAVHGAFDDPWGNEFMASQARHERLGSPLAERCVSPQTLTAQASAAQRSHVGLDTRFIDEDQSGRLTAHEGLAAVTPLTPRCFDVTASLFRRQQRFFYM